MEAVNKKYYIEIEVLTPLSIGAGAEKDWVKGSDFVVKGGHLYKLNLKKMAANGVDLSLLTSYYANKDSDAIVKLLGGKLEIVSDCCIDMPVDSDNDIKSFVRNQLSGNPVLPGSSLKGAVRSILFQYLGGSSKDGKEVFGSSNDGDEFMRFIKISDAEFEDTTLVNTKIFNLQKQGSWKGGWKHGGSFTDSEFKPTGFNTLYESLMPNQKGYASLMMSEKLYDNYEFNKKAHIKTDRKRPVLHDDISTLFGLINKHTEKYLQKEKAFFQKYSTDKTENIVDSIDNILSHIPEDNSYCILKMSAGSGFHSITGDWQFNDFTAAPLDRKRVKEENANPKSRKIAVYDGQLSLMGFVKLSVISAEQMGQINAETERKRIEKEEALRIENQRNEEERKRLEAEKREKEIYKSLICEAKNLYEEHKLEDSLKKYNEASAMYPQDESILQQITAIQNEIANIHNSEITAQLEKEADLLFADKRYEEAKHKYEEADALKCKPFYEQIERCVKMLNMSEGKLEDILKFSSPAACSGVLKKWVAMHGQLSEEDCELVAGKIKAYISTLNKGKQKEWLDFKKWKPMAEAIGDEAAKKIFESVNS